MALGRMVLKKKLPAKYHSPAGRRHLKRKKKKDKGTQAVYFKGIRTKSAKQRLKEAGLTEKELRAFGYK